MRTLFMCLLAIACTCSTQSPPATTSVQPKSKRIWTNDDMPSLSGGINVLGEKDTPKDDATVPAAKKEREQEKCESDAWVAAVTAILNSQGVPYDKRYWAERLFGNMCVENVTVGAVASRIDGDYTLDDGQRLRLSSTIAGGLPAAPVIVAAVDENRPLIIKWKGQPLVMTKVDYIDRQYNYVSVYSISSLMLTNALTGRILIFDLKTNSEKEIEGTLQLKVSKRQ